MADAKNRRVIAAGLIGNVMEWYDFAVYGFFAATIGKLFFPSEDPATSLIASFGAFAAGFLMRPLGAILFGHIGDMVGRKHVLVLSVLMMAIPTFLLGLLPTHAEIGIAAPILIVLLRMIQGVSVGGEYTGSFVFLVEHAPKSRRGFFGSWSLVGANGGILIGSAISALIISLTTDEQLLAWGWRIPFLIGIIVAGVGWIIRKGIPEQKVERKNSGSPLAEAVTGSRKQLLQSAGLNITFAIVFYVIFIYLSTWLVTEVGETHAEALNINTLSMIVLLVIFPLAAFASDRFGRKPFLLIGAGGLALFGYPLLGLMSHQDFWMILAGQIGFAVFLGMFVSVIPATISELFPYRVRVSAASLSYNIPFAIFGGTAPMVATWLISETGNPLSISWYLIAAAVLGFAVALTIKETKEVDMNE